MSTKQPEQSAADKALEIAFPPEDYEVDLFDRKVWHTAWAARGTADITAVESERLNHNVHECSVLDCPDCGYQGGIDDAKDAIRALDAEMK
jgi:hypothetical protein